MRAKHIPSKFDPSHRAALMTKALGCKVQRQFCYGGSWRLTLLAMSLVVLVWFPAQAFLAHPYVLRDSTLLVLPYAMLLSYASARGQLDPAHLGRSVSQSEAPDAAALAVRDPQLQAVRGEGEPRGLRPGGCPAGAAVGVALSPVAAEVLRDPCGHIVSPYLVLPCHRDVQHIFLHTPKQARLNRQTQPSDIQVVAQPGMSLVCDCTQSKDILQQPSKPVIQGRQSS